MTDLELRPTVPSDLPVFHRHRLDPEARHTAASTAEDAAEDIDLDAFTRRWTRLLADGAAPRTILVDGDVVGHVAAHGEPGRQEVVCWTAREFWGRGIATRALRLFLAEHPARPLHARAARDNAGWLRVLERCGFTVRGEDSGYAPALGEAVPLVLLELRA